MNSIWSSVPHLILCQHLKKHLFDIISNDVFLIFLSRVKPAISVQEDYSDACWDNHCVFQGVRKSAGCCDMESTSVRSLSPAWLAVAADWASANDIATHPACTRVCGHHRGQYGLAFQTKPVSKVQRLPKFDVLVLSCCMPGEHCTRKSATFLFLTSVMASTIPGATPGEITHRSPYVLKPILTFEVYHRTHTHTHAQRPKHTHRPTHTHTPHKPIHIHTHNNHHQATHTCTHTHTASLHTVTHTTHTHTCQDL
jgi:hypothetical protein